MAHGQAQEPMGLLFKQVHQAVGGAVDGRLREHGVSMAGYAALSALRQEPGLSNAALAARCAVTPQTMSQLVRQLEASGWVERLPHPTHGRILETRLTTSGRRVVERCHGGVEEVEDVMLAGFETYEVMQLRALLRRCLAALAEDPSGR